MTCPLCNLPKKLNAIELDRFWTVNVAEGATNRPWVVLQTKRHVSHIDKLSAEEAISLGTHIKNISSHLSKLKNVHKVHIYQLNESNPGHVHFHLTISTNKDKKEFGTLLNTPIPKTLSSQNKSGWLPRSYKLTHLEPSFLVRKIVSICNQIKKLNFVYPALQKILNKFKIDTGYAAEIYVTMNLLLFAFLVLLLPSSPKFYLQIAGILGLVRIVDIWSTQLSIILDRKARFLKSFERTFVLACINLLEVALIAAVWLRGSITQTKIDALAQGFRLATNRSTIETSSIKTLLIEFCCASTALLLLVVVLSVILGKIASERFDEVVID